MSLIKEFTKIIAEGEKQAQRAKAAPLVLTEEILGENKSDENGLYLGDNLSVMQSLLTGGGLSGQVQMIYIDPPFYSKANYDAAVKVGDQTLKYRAYDDKWEQGLSSYLKMLTARLYLMKELLADSGLIWLHLDWHVVHYAKVIMDEIFGEKNFVNEIIWNYKSGGTSKKHFARKHDTILVYAKSPNYRFYPLQEKSYNRGYKPYHFKGVQEYKDDIGWYTMVNMKDVWNIDMVGRTSRERTGYATQKPEQLLFRMIESCTREGDLCADFFCGSGTLAAAAAKLGRRFITCDMGKLAYESTIRRLTAQGTGFCAYQQQEACCARQAGAAGTHAGAAGIRTRANRAKMEARILLTREKLSEGDGELVRIRLLSLKARRLDQMLNDKEQALVAPVIAEDSLQLVDMWSVDFDYDLQTGVHKAQSVFVREKGNLTLSCEKIVAPGAHICVKVTDVLGNTVFERF